MALKRLFRGIRPSTSTIVNSMQATSSNNGSSGKKARFLVKIDAEPS
jgi:hypothetical protein